MPRTLALFASARRRGNTGQLMDEVAHRLEIEVVDLSACDFAPYDYEPSHRHDGFEALMERVLAHEQIIFASPVYWYAVSTPMKIFLDRITDFLDLPELLPKGRQLRGKRAFVLCTSIEEEVPPTFLAAFQQTFAYLGMRYGGCLHADCRNGYVAHEHEETIEKFVSLVNATSEE